MGVRRVYRILDDGVTFDCYSDRHRIAPWGLFSSQSALPSRFLVERSGQTLTIPSKTNFQLQKADRLMIETSGGGGYGVPHERERRGRAARRRGTV